MKRYMMIAAIAALPMAYDLIVGHQPLDLTPLVSVLPPLVLFGAGETTTWALLRRRPRLGLALLAFAAATVAGLVWHDHSAQPTYATAGVALVAFAGLLSGWERITFHHTSLGPTNAGPADADPTRIDTRGPGR
jgi:hypothetical protein